MPELSAWMQNTEVGTRLTESFFLKRDYGRARAVIGPCAVVVVRSIARSPTLNGTRGSEYCRAGGVVGRYDRAC